jgi:hypothetical protein
MKTNAQRNATYEIADVQAMFKLTDGQMSAYCTHGNLWAWWSAASPIARPNNIDLLKIAAIIYWRDRGMTLGDLLLVTDQIEAIAENFYGDRLEFLKSRFLADGYVLTVREGTRSSGIEGVNVAPTGYYRGYWLGSFEHLFPMIRDAARDYWEADPSAYQRFLESFDGRSQTKTDTF